jgi:LysM repeat protein
LVIVVVGAHVSVLILAVLFGGCVKGKKVPRLTTAAPVQEIRAPEAMPESIVEPKGMVEETDLLIAREPEAISPKAETALPSAPQAGAGMGKEKGAATAEQKETIIAGAAAQKEEAVTATAERKEVKIAAAVERKEKELSAAGEPKEKGPIVPEVKRPAAAAIPAPAAGVQKHAGGTHKVAPGESLWKLSQQYGVSVADLAGANNLKADSAIRVGQVLMIPGPVALPEPKAREKAPAGKAPAAALRPRAREKAPAGKAPAAALRPRAGEKAPAEKTGVSGVFKRHVIQKGETLSSIAKRYRVSLKKLVEVNRIEDPGKVRAGQSLVVPQ